MFLRIEYIIIFFIGCCQPLFSQGGSVRIAVYGGGNLEFVFNSMGDYNTGITQTNWSLLGLEVNDDVALPNFTTWRLTMEADDADADGFLTGLNPLNTLPFNAIEIRATVAAGCASCNTFGSPFVGLTAAPVVIADGGPAVGPPLVPGLATATDQLNISYRCGVAVSMLSGAADYYSDDIVFTLEMNP